VPLPRGTDFAAWREALVKVLHEIATVQPDALVVSLGVDTFEHDPISGFRLRSEDFLRVGADIEAAGLPTLFVFEGGYAVAEIGVNAANVLEGFSGAAG
jgi:acetoin utilization deacetylase AcuC-like enzyme